MLSSKSIIMIRLKFWCVQTIQPVEETLIHCTTPYQLGLRSVVISKSIDLLSLYVLFSQYRSCDNTLENCFFQISSYSRAYLVIIYKKTKGQVPLGPLLGKQNVQANEVYCRGALPPLPVAVAL